MSEHRSALGHLAWLLLICGLSACRSTSAEPAPYVVVLGTAQDAGLPQIACRRDCCEAARKHPDLARRTASLLVVDPRSGSRWLIDATPDLREQVQSAHGHPPERQAPAVDAGRRPPLFEGIFLTHAHTGHYTGLALLGREGYGAGGQRVYASPRMGEFLSANGPWAQLVELDQIRLEPLTEGQAVELAPDLHITPLRVPHRDEYSDTLAFIIRGPRHSMLYVPDTDRWDLWQQPVEDVLASVDTALLDGTFFDARELPGRDLNEIPHPPIAQSLESFGGLGPAAPRILFTHLNHSNPAANPESEEAARIREAGMEVAWDGQVLDL